MKWININDKKPEVGQNCIVLTNNGEDFFSILDAVYQPGHSEDWSTSDGDFVYSACMCEVSPGNITHWMQIPDLPKTE